MDTATCFALFAFRCNVDGVCARDGVIKTI